MKEVVAYTVQEEICLIELNGELILKLLVMPLLETSSQRGS